MASFGFGSGLRKYVDIQLPSGDSYSVPGPGSTFKGQLSNAMPYANLISGLLGTVSNGVGLFSDLSKPNYKGSGLTSQEILQLKKQDNSSVGAQAGNMALSLLSSILSILVL